MAIISSLYKAYWQKDKRCTEIIAVYLSVRCVRVSLLQQQPQTSYCAPHFHSLPSLLNMINFENESETDKTAHKRKQFNALASVSYCTRSQMVRFPPDPPKLAENIKHV